MADSYRVGDYLLGMEGLAILRSWGTDPVAVRTRVEEIAAINSGLDEDPYSVATAIPEYDVVGGYRAWASTYDGKGNILIDEEERVVHPLLAVVPIGRALDAACGTGRHARWLADRGHEVVGIDASEEMLALARDKVPAGRFQVGQLEALSLHDASVDLVTCALALTHLTAIDNAIAEFARVLAPGGRLILSDVHPLSAGLGLHAFFRTESGIRGCIRNQYHPVSHYLAAFKLAGFEVVRCIEVPWGEDAIAAQPVYHFIPEALGLALRGLPLLLVWEVVARYNQSRNE